MSSLRDSRLNLTLGFSAVLNSKEELTIRGSKYEGYGVLGSIAGTSSRDYGFITGNFPVSVYGAYVYTDAAEIEVSFYENSVFTGGTLLPVYNSNRRIGKVHDGDIYQGVTATVVGDPISGPKRLAGSQGRDLENVFAGTIFLLEPNSNYLFRLENPGAGAINAQSVFDFAELR